MPSLQIVFATDLETMSGLMKFADAEHMTLQAYMRKLTRDHLAAKQAMKERHARLVTEPEKPREYTQKDFDEFQGMRRNCETWEVNLWLQNHPGFDPKAFKKPSAKAARKRPSK